MLLAAGAGFASLGLLAAIHPAIIVAVGAAAFAMLPAFFMLAMILAVLLVAGAMLARLLMLVMALMLLSRSGLRGGRSGDRQSDSGNYDLHFKSPPGPPSGQKP
jgi:hypothetical protein